MAIIYTYPRLTNPQGNELIVVSDVNNKNATRLITLASIASLVPVGSGCATTYVLKPVICDSGNCTSSEFSNSWLYTCKEEFAQFADTGTVVNIKNNNKPVEGNTNSDCWYVETWSPIPTATTCENCCTDAQVDICIYLPCSSPASENGEARANDEVSNKYSSCSNNIPFPVIVENPLGQGCDPVIHVTHSPSGDSCCMQLQSTSVGAPGNATPDIVVSPVSDCNDAMCQEAPDLNRQYTKCQTDCITSELPETYIINENLGALGPVIIVTYDDGVDTQESCYERGGMVAESPTVLPNVTATQNKSEECAAGVENGSCIDVVDVYTICPSSEGTGAPQQIYTTVTAINPGEVIVVEINGVEACYTKEPETECRKLTQGITNITTTPTNDCEDTAYCPAADTFYQIRPCGEENFVNTSTDLSAYAPLSGTYVWGSEGDCYEIKQGGDGVGNPAPDFTGYTDYTNSPTNPCFCCINYNVFEYEKCSYDFPLEPLPGCANMDQTVYVQVADPTNPPANAVISFGANSCCYSLVGDSCQDPTLDYNIEDGVTVNSCNDEPCLTLPEPKKKFVYQKCNGSLSTDCAELLSPVVVELFEANASQYAILSSGEVSCCYVKQGETEENPTEGYTKTGTWDGDCIDGFPEACQDDQEFTFQYEHCDGVNSEGCNGTVSPVVVQGTAAQLLNNLILEDSSTGNRCCYVRAEQVTSPPTANYEIVNVSLRDCTEESLISAGCQEGK